MLSVDLGSAWCMFDHLTHQQWCAFESTLWRTHIHNFCQMSEVRQIVMKSLTGRSRTTRPDGWPRTVSPSQLVHMIAFQMTFDNKKYHKADKAFMVKQLQTILELKHPTKQSTHNVHTVAFARFLHFIVLRCMPGFCCKNYEVCWPHTHVRRHPVLLSVSYLAGLALNGSIKNTQQKR